MRKITFALAAILFVLPFFAAADGRFYAAGDHLAVFALEGLPLLEAPDPDSGVVAVIPFGEAVDILPDPGPVRDFEANGLSGSWAHVGYAGAQGWAFDGFLSRLPVPGPDETTIDRYVAAHFTQISEKTEKNEGTSMEGEPAVLVQRRFEGGASISFVTDGRDKWISSDLPVDRMEEGFLLVRAISRSPSLITRDFPVAVEADEVFDPDPEEARRGIEDFYVAVDREDGKIVGIEFDFDYADTSRYFYLSLPKEGGLRIEQDAMDRDDLPPLTWP
jgi:hypothetical protein